jgi:glycosyltransferase involved in cell wall biosynthesis
MVFARRQAEALGSHGITVESFYIKSRTSPRILFAEALRFLRLRRAFQPDLIHAHFGTMTALFTVLTSGRDPVMITYRGSDLNLVPTSNGPRALLGRIFSQLAALGAARMICVSRKLRDRLWWCRDRVTILPSGVDPAVFFPMPRLHARRELGWPDEDLVVLFNAGHDAHNKRLDLAQAAFAQVQARLPHARLRVLAGDIEPQQVPFFMNAADCLLVTSDAEGSPTVVQEALATNLPVVSVDTGDVAERLCGVTETCIVPRDARALADAVGAILLRRARSNGRLRVREVDASHIADELAHLYLETVALSTPQKISTWNTTLSSQR